MRDLFNDRAIRVRVTDGTSLGSVASTSEKSREPRERTEFTTVRTLVESRKRTRDRRRQSERETYRTTGRRSEVRRPVYGGVVRPETPEGHIFLLGNE